MSRNAFDLGFLLIVFIVFLMWRVPERTSKEYNRLQSRVDAMYVDKLGLPENAYASTTRLTGALKRQINRPWENAGRNGTTVETVRELIAVPAETEVC